MADERTRKKLGKGRHHSALKRQRQNVTRHARNTTHRSRIKTAVKAVREKKTPEVLAKAIPLIDKAVNKGILPRARAARLTSRLTKLVHQARAS